MIANEINFLYRIQTEKHPNLVEDLNYSDLYKIDLKTREIDSPPFLGIKKDHQVEIIYFVMDRFYDYTDLSTTVGIIQYFDPDNKIHIYPIPYYDIYSIDGKMIIPWYINRIITDKEGDIEYFFRFFKVSLSDKTNELELSYNLSTKPAKTKILYGLDANFEEIPEEEENRVLAEIYENLIQQVQELKVTWLEMPDDDI